MCVGLAERSGALLVRRTSVTSRRLVTGPHTFVIEGKDVQGQVYHSPASCALTRYYHIIQTASMEGHQMIVQAVLALVEFTPFPTLRTYNPYALHIFRDLQYDIAVIIGD